MSHDLLLSLIAFTLVGSLTPGPNNTMLMASGANFGFARTRAHIAGVTIGYAVMICAVALGIGRVFTAFPAIFTALRIVSIAYLLWLAWRIATAGSTDPMSTEDSRPMTFLEAALFQCINPKGWMMAVSATANYVSPQTLGRDAAIVTTVFFLASMVSTTTWALFGTSLRPLLGNARAMTIFNVTMAIALVASLWPIVRDMI
jgi:threonine/homoserine/homoserine lactone efflux protein